MRRRFAEICETLLPDSLLLRLLASIAGIPFVALGGVIVTLLLSYITGLDLDPQRGETASVWDWVAYLAVGVAALVVAGVVAAVASEWSETRYEVREFRRRRQ